MSKQTIVTGNLSLGVDPVTGAISTKTRRSSDEKIVALYSTNIAGNANGLIGPDGKEFLVVSSAAPNNADGRADGRRALSIHPSGHG